MKRLNSGKNDHDASTAGQQPSPKKIKLNSSSTAPAVEPQQQAEVEMEQVEPSEEEEQTYEEEKQRFLKSLVYTEHEEEDDGFTVSDLTQKSTDIIAKTVQKSKDRKSKKAQIKTKSKLVNDMNHIREMEENIQNAQNQQQQQGALLAKIDSGSSSSVTIEQTASKDMDDENNDEDEFESVSLTNSSVSSSLHDVMMDANDDEEFESAMDDETQYGLDDNMIGFVNEEQQEQEEDEEQVLDLYNQPTVSTSSLMSVSPASHSQNDKQPSDTTESQDNEKKKRKSNSESVKRKTKYEKQSDLDSFKTLLSVFFCYNERRNRLADSQLIQGLLFSMIPDNILKMTSSYRESEEVGEVDNKKNARQEKCPTSRTSRLTSKGKTKSVTPTSDITLVQSLVKWFQTTFTIETPEVEADDYRKAGISYMNNLVLTTNESKLVRAIQDRKLRDSDSFIVFLSMFRCLGVSCRQVSVIDPYQFLKRLEWNKKIEVTKSSKGKRESVSSNRDGTHSRWSKKNSKSKNSDSDGEEVQEVLSSDEELKQYIKEQKMKKKRKSPSKNPFELSNASSTNTTNHNDIWIEMYSVAQKTWIRIDHDLYEQKDLMQSIMNNFKFTNSSSKDKPTVSTRICEFPVFILAFGKNNSYIRDVTYNFFVTRPKDTISGHQKFESSTGWFQTLVNTFNKEEEYRSLPEYERNIIENEQEKIKTITDDLLKQIPKTQDAYKAHPLYCIEKWISKYEALYPPDPPILGKCGQHNVYARSNIHTLHRKDRWLKEGRQVLDGEKPYKVVKASHLSSGANCELYGEWQTKAYEPPVAKDGMVPKNERGQVDLWHERMLPTGTVHINLRGIAQVARRLKIDYAPAMTGFEVHARRSVPKIEGIIVCSEYEDLLKDAYVQNQRIKLERLKKKKELRIRKNWRKLVLGLLAREDIHSRYGHLLVAEQEKQKKKVVASSMLDDHDDKDLDLGDEMEDEEEDSIGSSSTSDSQRAKKSGLRSVNGVVVEYEQLT